MKIIAATNNKNKVREISEIFTPLGFEVISQSDAGIDVEVEETGNTFEKKAHKKARAVAMVTDDYVIADDSGLCVDALGGRLLAGYRAIARPSSCGRSGHSAGD